MHLSTTGLLICNTPENRLHCSIILFSNTIQFFYFQLKACWLSKTDIIQIIDISSGHSWATRCYLYIYHVTYLHIIFYKFATELNTMYRLSWQLFKNKWINNKKLVGYIFMVEYKEYHKCVLMFNCVNRICV